MKHNYFTCILFLLSFWSFGQIKGIVTDAKGNPMPFVNIYVQDTYISTTSNDNGRFELNVKTPGTYIILFQYLGYKTEKKIIEAEKFPQVIDVVLQEEEYTLDEVVINRKVDPAIAIIKQAIANRKDNAEKTARYTADFYSRGLFRVKNLPKTVLGQKLDFFDDVIDSTRSGILYLSETVSKITFQKPDKLKEVIIASKVSGNDNGFSFNSAAQANFDFYENFLDFDAKVCSPIGDNAFNYYKFHFEGSFADENNKIINKIKITPKRNSEPAFSGYIYITDLEYAIYAVEAQISGAQIQNPALNTLGLKQNFSYNNKTNVWAKNTQTIDFEAGLLGINMSGRFTYVYTNLEFPEKFEKKTFTSEVLRFEKDANKKENSFWETIRPVPLSTEESTDYVKKEALQEKKKSQVYLDSIDAKRNKFRLSNLLGGYTYSNSFKKRWFNYDGPLMNTHFNTVQGWNSTLGLSYTQRDKEEQTYTRIGTRFNYGFSEKKLRVVANFTRKFNNTTDAQLTLSGGSYAAQFNPSNPITPLINTTSSLFFVNNFMKLYEKNFAAATFSQEIVNGINVSLTTEYAERKPLFNTTNQRAVKSEDDYTSNNPLLPFDETTPVFDKHNLVKTSLTTQFRFGQKYWTRPDGKFNLYNSDFPTLYVTYEKGFAGSDKRYEFDYLGARIKYNLDISNKGNMDLNLRMGRFFNADQISFADYKHFNGNQTHIASGNTYTDVFNNLPYYSASTNDRFIAFHVEHNDKGWLMNKIPLLNKLQTQLVVGYHNLAVPDRKPYQEFSIGLDNLGWGKFRLLRVDYLRSYQNGYQGDAVLFGLKFLNVVE